MVTDNRKFALSIKKLLKITGKRKHELLIIQNGFISYNCITESKLSTKRLWNWIKRSWWKNLDRTGNRAHPTICATLVHGRPTVHCTSIYLKHRLTYSLLDLHSLDLGFIQSILHSSPDPLIYNFIKAYNIVYFKEVNGSQINLNRCCLN